MPLQAPYKTNKLGGGRKTAQYRDAQGRTRDCIITGDGATPGNVDIEIKVPRSTTAGGQTRHTSGNHVIEDVPIATSVKDTEAVFWRAQAAK